MNNNKMNDFGSEIKTFYKLDKYPRQQTLIPTKLTTSTQRLMKYILGYPCQSQVFPELKSHNTSTLKYIQSLTKDNRIKYIKEKSHQNLLNLKLLLEKNYQRNILAFRISNSLIPFGDSAYYDIEKEHKDQLREIGEYANKCGMYLSFHASEFIVLNSKTKSTVDNSVMNLNFFGKVLTLMELKNTPIIVVHIGGYKQFASWQEACDEWCKNYELLSKETQSFIVVENDQNSHSIDSCMYIHRKVGIPVVFDHAHYDYKPTKGISMEQAMKLAMETWKGRTPKVHVCSQAPGVKVHNHGQDMKLNDFLKVYNAIEATGVKKCIMMLEVRGKDEALERLEKQLKQYAKENKIKF